MLFKKSVMDIVEFTLFKDELRTFDCKFALLLAMLEFILTDLTEMRLLKPVDRWLRFCNLFL